MTLNTYNLQPIYQHVIISNTLWFLQYLLSPDNILNFKVTMVQSRLNQGHTTTSNQYPCQISTSFTLHFQRKSLDIILSGSLQLGQSSNQGHMTIAHTYLQTHTSPCQLPPSLKFKVNVTRLKVKSRSAMMLDTYTPQPMCPCKVSTSYRLLFLIYSADQILMSRSLQ